MVPSENLGDVLTGAGILCIANAKGVALAPGPEWFLVNQFPT